MVYPYELKEGIKVSHGPSKIPQQGPVIVKGNLFQDFTHPRLLAGREWWYWDNCLIPQLMMPNPANAQGSKLWCRLVYQSTAPREITRDPLTLAEHQERVESWIEWESQGRYRDIWQIIPVAEQTQSQGRKILWVQSRAETIEHYYGITNQQLEQRIRQVCDRWGLELVIRHKQDRRSRVNNSLTQQCQQQQYRAVICSHSASAIEILAAGRAVIALGAETAHDLNTSWQQFEQDEYQQVKADQIRLQIQRLLTQTWHKRELLRGDWSHWDPCAEPYTQWRLIEDNQR